MSRIKINEIDGIEELSEKQTKGIRGGGIIEPAMTRLEDSSSDLDKGDDTTKGDGTGLEDLDYGVVAREE